MVTKQAAIAYLKANGAAKAVGEFSGGNDEGGFDGITLTDATGEELAGIDVWSNRKNAVLEYLEEVLYGHYGGFAGEFSVYGTVTLDAATGECKMTGQESVESYEPFDHSF